MLHVSVIIQAQSSYFFLLCTDSGAI